MVNCPISTQAQNSPHHPALICDAHILSYQELDRHINHLCAYLQTLGVQKNSRVAFIAPSTPATIQLLFALFRLQACAVPLSPRLPEQQIPSLLKQLATTHFLDPHALHPPHTTSTFDTLDSMALATLLLTSGSSGIPKIACHSLNSHLSNAQGSLSALNLIPDSQWLLSLPLNHVSGLSILFRCFLRGATIVLSSTPLATTLLTHQISHLSLVPTLLYRLLATPLNSLKCILLGGAPISSSLLAQASALPLYTTYGLTEISSMLTLASPDMLKGGIHAGKALPHREFKLDENHEIWIRGEPLFQGYLNPDTQQIDAPFKEGWFPTKDMGSLTKEGNLQILGRKDRMFISGGENIHPEEIERALTSLPGIEMAIVVSRADLEFGERPIAFLLDHHGYTLSSLRQALEPLLPRFKHPIEIFPYPSDQIGPGIKPSYYLMKVQQKSSARIQGSVAKGA